MPGRATAYGRHKHLVGKHRGLRLAFSAGVGVGLLIVLTACSDETREQISDAIDEVGAEESAGESAPEPAPESAEDDDLSNEDWIIIGL